FASFGMGVGCHLITRVLAFIISRLNRNGSERMYPVLFEFFGLKLYSFGLIVALAALVAILWMIRRARQAGENEEQYLEIAFWLIISGFVGARLFYFIF